MNRTDCRHRVQATLERWRADLSSEIARRGTIKSPGGLDISPIELLGYTYERSLDGATDSATPPGRARRASEARRDKGVYYTPRFIVNAIVDRTLEPITRGKTPEELAQIRIIDPACGSGIFLLAAFEHMLAAHERSHRKRGGAARLTLAKKREILKNTIHGVDVDGDAVEVAQVSLCLKLLEGERDGLAGSDIDSRVMDMLPELRNLRRGDGLLGSAVAGGAYHAVLGNPPYVRIQRMNAQAPAVVEAYRSRFRSAQAGNFNMYAVFVERALELLRPEGRVGLILPHTFFQAKFGAGLRELLAERGAVHEIVDFGHAQVFEGVTTYTCLFFLGGSPAKEFELRRVEGDGDLPNALQKALARGAERISTAELARPTWNFRAGGGELAERLRSMKPSLGEVCDRIFQGLVTGADDVFFLEARGKSIYSRALGREVDVEPALLHPLLKGSAHIRRWALDPTPLRALFPYRSPEEGAELLSQTELRRAYPKAWGYLRACKDILEARERGKWKGNERWHAYGRSQALGLVGRPKILCPSIAKRSSFAVEASGGMFFSGSGGGGGGGYGLLVRPDISMDYLCALLNSRPLEWLLKTQTTPFRGGYMASNRQYIEGLPIRLPNLDSPWEKALYDELSGLSREMAELIRRRRGSGAREQAILDKTILEMDRAIDLRVYDLYDISKKERAVIDAGEQADGDRRLGDAA